jgi:hypothetical protein
MILVLYILLSITIGSLMAFGFSYFEKAPAVAAIGIAIAFAICWPVFLVFYGVALFASFIGRRLP